MDDNPLQWSNDEIAKSLEELGISPQMITLSIDSNYAAESLPLLLFASVYYAVLTVVHLVTGVGISHALLAVFTGAISIACFVGRRFVINGVIPARYVHLLAVILLLGLVVETYAQIWMVESTEPIAEIVIAVMIMGIVLIALWAFLFMSTMIIGVFLVMLFQAEDFSVYLQQPYVLLLVAVSFFLSSIIFLQRRRSVVRNTKLHLIDRQRNTALVNANAAKNQFLSSMSHELRTPLNAIYGFSQLMASDDQLSQKHRGWVSHILKASEHLLYLISQVLNLSKIEANHVEVQCEPVIAGELIDYSVIKTKDLTTETRITVQKKVPPDMCEALCHTDPKAMHQILLNLLSNAIKYNQVGGTVTVSLAALDERSLVIRVADTGLGIPAEKQPYLFEPFNRLGREESSITGTGIGLTITSSLCEALGVELSFTSEEGVGTTFSLAIPRSAPEHGGAQSTIGVMEPVN